VAFINLDMNLAFLSLMVISTVAHGPNLAINTELGVPGFPDCTQPISSFRDGTDVEAAAKSLVCQARPKDFDAQISVACVGDSITAGVHASSSNTTYPSRLQAKLGNKYKVTNLGACGSTMLRNGDSPFWKRPQYQALTAAKWDVIIIMLGTNDAKDKGNGGPMNWPHNCTGTTQLTCPFSQDFKSMISLVKTLGTTSAGPDVYVMIPPPLMATGAYGMNQTVINDVLPILVPAIAAANELRGAIDVFNLFGGSDQKAFPPSGCTLNTLEQAQCKFYCSASQSWTCDQCHPDDEGYDAMAGLIKYVIS